MYLYFHKESSLVKTVLLIAFVKCNRFQEGKNCFHVLSVNIFRFGNRDSIILHRKQHTQQVTHVHCIVVNWSIYITVIYICYLHHSYVNMSCLSCHVLSCLVMSCHVLSCLVMSCHVLSCLVMSCHVLSCLSSVIEYSIKSFENDNFQVRIERMKRSMLRTCSKQIQNYFCYFSLMYSFINFKLYKQVYLLDWMFNKAK